MEVMPSTQPFPTSPTKQESEVNRHNHPYPIRTTSSSLLTRSNSVGSAYKPPLASVNPASPALGRSQGRGHKHSKSSNSVPPLPLPTVPPSPKRPNADRPMEFPSPTPAFRRGRRSETLPSFSTLPPTSPTKMVDLPSNPKAWSARNLSAYLSSALRLKGGGSLPLPVIQDITTFVLDAKLTGRVFLRLTQGDLDDMGINHLWKEALLNSSRTLRQNVIQGRIWGFGNSLTEEVESPAPTIQSPSIVRSPSEIIFAHAEPTEGDDKAGWIGRALLPRTRSGRVRNLVADFERTSGASGSSASSADEGKSDDDEVLNADDTCGIPLGSEVGTSEDDAGYASAESVSGSEIDEKELFSVLEDMPVTPFATDATDADQTISLPKRTAMINTPPPVYAVRAGLNDNQPPLPSDDSKVPSEECSVEPVDHLNTGRATFMSHSNKDSVGSDGTMENLIANFHGNTGSWGVRAWERAAELEEGATARRVYDPSIESSSKPSQAATVIGLFEPPPSLPLPPTLSVETNPPSRQEVSIDATQVLGDNPPSENRVLLDELQLKLEEVERKLTEMEARDLEWDGREREIAELKDTLAKQSEALTSRVLSRKPEEDAASEDRVNQEGSLPMVLSNSFTEDPCYDPNDDDPSPASLPGYVLLVSLGVCAVIVRVVLRKVAGKKSY